MTDILETRLTLITTALEDLKARDITRLDVAELTQVADHMIIASGTSNRHLKALASHVIEQVKAAGFAPLGSEGQDSGDWVLVDLGSILVHIMTPAAREHYALERLWKITPSHPEADHKQGN